MTKKIKTDDETIRAALEILARRMREPGDALQSPQAVKDYLRVRMAALEHETFWAVFLDAQNRAIETEQLFRGTLAQTSVYPREVVKRALAHNAAAIIVAHNHPSGVCEPSKADQYITETLKTALALVDVKLLDHFIVGGMDILSFAETGRI